MIFIDEKLTALGSEPVLCSAIAVLRLWSDGIGFCVLVVGFWW